MKNYIDEIYSVSEFMRDNPAFANQAEKALQYLKGHCPNSEGTIFVVIEVENYNCVAYLADEFAPYTLAEMIAPFDKDRIYPPSGTCNKVRFRKILRRKHYGKLFQNNRISPRQKYLRRL